MANPNPSPETRIGAERGPSPGKSSEQKTLEYRNAEAAVRIRAKFLSAAESKLADMSDDQIMAILDGNMLTLMKDSETRGLGAPVQPVDHSSTDGSMTPRPTVIEFIAPKASDESDD